MSLELDDETRAELAPDSQWPRVVATFARLLDARLERDRARQAGLRESRAVQLTEAKYQRDYASTETGRERRRAASRAYRQRRKAS